MALLTGGEGRRLGAGMDDGARKFCGEFRSAGAKFTTGAARGFARQAFGLAKR